MSSSTTTFSISMDADLKEAAEALFADLGMDLNNLLDA